MSLNTGTTRRMYEAVTDEVSAGPQVVDAINQGQNLAQQSAASSAALIVATSVSPTTNFASLAVGDKVIHIPATAGNASFLAVVTAGTLPAAAVVGDLYIAMRTYTSPATVKGAIVL